MLCYFQTFSVLWSIVQDESLQGERLKTINSLQALVPVN